MAKTLIRAGFEMSSPKLSVLQVLPESKRWRAGVVDRAAASLQCCEQSGMVSNELTAGKEEREGKGA